jgi:hypothetical protein
MRRLAYGSACELGGSRERARESRDGGRVSGGERERRRGRKGRR